jgi:nitroimidazol reductase NimA-like FMN-containing flavoprotein (pyridoxamine 5'-phosphate oxidase superfamily)
MSARELLAGVGTKGIGDVPVEQCWLAIESTDLGRLAVIRPQGDVDILPINYAVDGTTIYFRTAPGSKFDSLKNRAPVALEIDHFDEEAAYSIVVKGRAERLEAPAEIDAADALPLAPWIPTVKLRWIRIRPTEVTGRVFARGPEPISYA